MSLYVKVDLGFFTHRKTIKLVSKIGEAGYYLPIRLWTFAAQNQPDGVFATYTEEELALCLGYATSNASSMLQAMLQAGFLDENPLRIHDWAEHNAFHANYSERAKKAASARWSKAQVKSPPAPPKEKRRDEMIGDEASIATSNASSNASSMLQASPKHADQKPPTPTHSHSSANLEPEPVPTVNHPTLAQCIDHFLACSDYCEAEIKRAFNGFEVVKDPAGNWIWGQAQAGRPARLVTDWRIALEQRMADYRMNNPDSPITRSPITALSRECKRIMKELGQ